MRAETDIIRNWDYEKASVSIVAMAYNHAAFISKCLDGFLEQETDFPFEIVIHDDCSTDGTTEIIRQYETRYPHIIKPIYEEENQFSKHRRIIREILLPNAHGKYVAFCECDDLWCSPKKLKIQYDYMEQHEDCSMCVHNTFRHDLLTGEDTLFNTWNQFRILSEEDVFFGWNVHTSSYFLRSADKLFPDNCTYWFGDYVMLTTAFSRGHIACFPQVMSTYNCNNINGTTYKNHTSGQKLWKSESLRNEYLGKYNELTAFKYNEIVQDRIAYNNIWLTFLESESDWSFAMYRKVKETVKQNPRAFKRTPRWKADIKSCTYLSFLLINIIKRSRKRRS